MTSFDDRVFAPTLWSLWRIVQRRCMRGGGCALHSTSAIQVVGGKGGNIGRRPRRRGEGIARSAASATYVLRRPDVPEVNYSSVGARMLGMAAWPGCWGPAQGASQGAMLAHHEHAVSTARRNARSWSGRSDWLATLRRSRILCPLRRFGAGLACAAARVGEPHGSRSESLLPSLRTRYASRCSRHLDTSPSTASHTPAANLR